MKPVIKLRPSIKILFIMTISVFSFGESCFSTGLNQIIKAFCIEEFKQEHIRNNLKVDHELGETICDCFINRINNNESMESARQNCKEDALKIINSKTT